MPTRIHIFPPVLAKPWPDLAAPGPERAKCRIQAIARADGLSGVDEADERPVTLGDPLFDSRWDEQLARCPEATFFHGSAWARVLQESYGLTPFYLVHLSGAGTTSLLPLMGVDSWLTGRRGVSLPFTDEAAPLCADQRSFDTLFAAARLIGAARRWKYIECRGGLSYFPAATPSVSFFGHRLDLRGGTDAVFAACEPSTRRAVRKAEQNRVEIEFSNEPGAMEEFYGLLCQTRQRHGVPPQPRGFFEQIQRHVIARDQGCVVLARTGGRPVAGAVYFHFGGTVTYKFGASDQRFQDLRANNLVMWSAIRHFAARGFAALDFGRTSRSNAGLRRFKLGWGAKERPIEYVRWELPSGRYASVPDAAAGWHTRALARLPRPLFKLVGSLLYPHLA